MKPQKFKLGLAGWGFVSVGTIFILIFAFYPMVDAFLLSLQSGMGINLRFVGLANYRRLFSDVFFLTAVRNTLLYLVVQVPVMLFLGITLASILNNKTIKFRGFFRTAIFMTCITSLVAYSTVFGYLFGHNGIINMAMVNIGLIDQPIGWLFDPFWARITIIIAITWRWTGYNMIFYLSAMQNIDENVYEAARIDGANTVQQFFRITIPLLKPIILFTSIMSTIGTLQLFDEVWTITNRGGPGISTLTISPYIYNLMFVFTPDFGYAATVSYAIVFMVVILAIIQFKIAGDKREKGR